MSEITAGGAIFTRLKALGVDCVFANSGTDFPPVIEGLAEAAAEGIDLPRALVIPHEHAAVSMAHGYTLMTGRPQAVMLHTNVGLSNGATGAINAACEHVPMILMSGRTPVTEQDRFGARTVPIGWGQEMRDQAALVREACKWDYELRFPEQIAPLLDRAHAIADSTPRGPVYLSLPREVLCEPCPAEGLSAPGSIAPARLMADPEEIARAAELLANARAPLVIAQRGLGSEPAFRDFADWVERWGIPVCHWWATHLGLPTDHPCNIGPEPGAAMAEADVILVLDSLAPWWPDKHALAEGAQVINMGPDPLFSRFPVRCFPSAVTLAGETPLNLAALMSEMDRHTGDRVVRQVRRRKLTERAARVRADTASRAKQGNRSPCTKAWVAHCLGEALGETGSTVFSELGVPLGALSRSEHRSWFQEPHSGGLGWAFPAALGAKLAEPGRMIVATMGDGSYMFSNPTVCHQVAEGLGLAVLVIVLNNGEWGTVRQSVTGLYPKGHAARANSMPLTGLAPVPDFTATAAASRAWAESVTEGSAVPEAIARALAVVRDEGRTALLDIRIAD